MLDTFSDPLKHGLKIELCGLHLGELEPGRCLSKWKHHYAIFTRIAAHSGEALSTLHYKVRLCKTDKDRDRI
jgi:hypothetical protein